MREIKFRAWDCDNKIVVYPDSELEVVFCFDKVGLSIYHSTGYELNSFEAMQYTGLKDKNGKEIYEGDILLYDSNSKTSVFYKNGAFVRSYGNSNMYLLYDSFIEDGCLCNYEVIGNIYENPELLEGEE